MMAAAKCPSCGHLFELRDGFGEQLPLAYCSSCDSYYLEKVGECKWCGTKPEHPPIAPMVWKTAGAAALVIMVGAAYVLRNRAPDEVSPVVERARKAAGVPTDPRQLPIDTALARSIASAAQPTTPSVLASNDAAVGGTSGVSGITAQGEVAPSPDASVVGAQSSAMVIPGPAAGGLTASSGASTTTTKSRRAPRWVSSVSRDWVIVRAGASKQSRIVASIGPNSRVQLGETRGTWRRVRAKGLAGWVEQASFSVARR